MSYCFVIQPIDPPNTKRFEDVFEPAILAAGFDEAYRVDRDPTATVLIDKIDERIRDADACLADISIDNPNVWFELGYALALGKLVVMVCAEGRDRFPFDIQHRAVIRYKSESQRDFDSLRDEISDRLKAQLASRAVVEEAAARPIAAPQSGLDAQQLAALAIIGAEYIGEGIISAYQLQQTMENVGFTKIAATIAIRGLERMNLVEAIIENNGRETFGAYRATEAGLDWLEQNQHRLALRYASASPDDTEIDELPF